MVKLQEPGSPERVLFPVLPSALYEHVHVISCEHKEAQITEWLPPYGPGKSTVRCYENPFLHAQYPLVLGR